MGMRETPRSLSIYFVIVGLLGLVSNLAGIAQLRGNIFAVLLVLPGIGFSLVFLYFGFRLRHLLLTSAQQIMRVLVASAIYLAIIIILNLLGGGIREVVPPGFGLLITWYLIRNVRRLSTDAQTKAA